MNYGGMDASQSTYVWTLWQKHFLFIPKKIEGKWYWLRTIYERFYIASWDPMIVRQHQFAVDLFDLMTKNHNDKI